MRRIVLLAALALPAYAMADMMQPGLYRTVVESTGEKAERKDQCISQKDIDEGLSGLDRDPSCKVQDLKLGASSVSYRTVCGNADLKVVSQVNGTFSRDSFDLNLGVTISGEKPMKIHMTGKRIADCRKGK